MRHLPPARIPIRTRAVAAPDNGRRARGRAAGERAARSALCHPTWAPGINPPPQTAPRACRQRTCVPARPSAPLASPSARPRSRRRTAGEGRRNGPRGIGRLKRVRPPNRAPGSHRPAHLRHGRAGCARRPGEVAAHRPVLPHNHGRSRPTRVAYPRPRAGGGGDGQRAAGAGAGRRDQDAPAAHDARLGAAARPHRPAAAGAATDFGQPEGIPDAPAPRACKLATASRWSGRSPTLRDYGVLAKRCALRRQTPTQTMDAGASRAAHPHPRARGRGRTTGGGAARSALCHRTGYPAGIARRDCAAGVQAAQRHPGEALPNPCLHRTARLRTQMAESPDLCRSAPLQTRHIQSAQPWRRWPR